MASSIAKKRGWDSKTEAIWDWVGDFFNLPKGKKTYQNACKKFGKKNVDKALDSSAIRFSHQPLISEGPARVHPFDGNRSYDPSHVEPGDILYPCATQM